MPICYPRNDIIKDMERQPLLGEGRVTLQVSDPRELKGDARYKRSEVTSLQNSYPLRLLVPERASATACRWVYPLTYGGGLVGGDVISIDYEVGESCAMLVTSQESSKIYHCRDGKASKQKLTYEVENDAFLAVLGDPVVCFADARFKQTQRVEMKSSSNLVLLDWMTAGRMALDELWLFDSYQSLIEVSVDGELVFRDNQLLSDTPCQTVKQAMRDFQVMGTCVVLGEGLQHVVTHLKKLYSQPHTIGQQLATDMVCSYSPLEVETKTAALRGCYVRFVASSTALAAGVVKEIASAVGDVLGGDPYARKY
ncbi:uncharacterized protein LOC143287364 isoform X2 [Babylonia areolata]|uniref:uncharacterized protein LOC143287364 isoform X2 n=1 Tax=Babylonia areolata TaxID=304850 RepID=UPI003FD55E0D